MGSGRLGPAPLLTSGGSKLEFVNTNLHEQSHLQHSLFPASACGFCESIVGNGRPDPVLWTPCFACDPVLCVLWTPCFVFGAEVLRVLEAMNRELAA